MNCPFIENHKPQCSDHLSLRHLDEAMRYCLDDFRECPIYQTITRAAPSGGGPNESMYRVEREPALAGGC